jgi:hypothetical protein
MMKSVLRAPSFYTGIALTAVIVMRIEGTIHWPWLWVLSFLWIPCAIAAFCYFLWACVCLWLGFCSWFKQVRIALSIHDAR